MKGNAAVRHGHSWSLAGCCRLQPKFDYSWLRSPIALKFRSFHFPLTGISLLVDAFPCRKTGFSGSRKALNRVCFFEARFIVYAGSCHTCVSYGASYLGERVSWSPKRQSAAQNAGNVEASTGSLETMTLKSSEVA